LALRGRSQLKRLPFARQPDDGAGVPEERDDAGVRDGGDNADRIFADVTNVRPVLDPGIPVAGDRKNAGRQQRGQRNSVYINRQWQDLLTR